MDKTYNGTPSFKIAGDFIVKETPVFDYNGDLVGKGQEIMIDRNTFLECYHKWVETEYDDIDIDQDDWGN